MAALQLIVLACLLAIVSGSHYRYGTLSWQCQGNTANITLETAWRRSYFTPPPQVGATLTNVGQLSYGDGSSQNVNSFVTTANTYGDWVIASVMLEHTFPAPNNKGTPYTVTFSGSARINTLNNNAGKNWFLTTTLDCNLGSSPRSKMLPVAQVMPTKSSIVTFQIPAVTDDNSQLHYTLGTSMDICGAASGCANPPGLSVDAVSGVVTWNTANLATGLWCAVINVNTPTVRVPVDFLINYTKVAGTCAPGCTSPGKTCYLPSDCGTCSGGCVQPLPPYFIPPTPLSNASYNFALFSNVSFNLVAMSPQPNYVVSIQSASLPQGAVLSAPSGTNPVTVTFTWNNININGPTIVCFSTNDDHSLQSPQYCITLSISQGCTPACPDNAVCNSNGECTCIDGYFGANCTSYGGEIYDGDVIYGAVAMHESNFYYFNLTGKNAIKLVVDTLDAGLETSVYLSTETQQPSIVNNEWSSINNNPNTIVVLPTDPNYIQGQYYLAVEGWYTGLQDLVSYNITLFIN